jgi:hypothetical protein
MKIFLFLQNKTEIWLQPPLEENFVSRTHLKFLWAEQSRETKNVCDLPVRRRPTWASPGDAKKLSLRQPRNARAKMLRKKHFYNQLDTSHIIIKKRKYGLNKLRRIESTSGLEPKTWKSCKNSPFAGNTFYANKKQQYRLYILKKQCTSPDIMLSLFAQIRVHKMCCGS